MALNEIRANFFSLAEYDKDKSLFFSNRTRLPHLSLLETSKQTGKIILLPKNETNHVLPLFQGIPCPSALFSFLFLSFWNSFVATRITRYVCNIKEASEARIPLIPCENRNAGRIHLQMKKVEKRREAGDASTQKILCLLSGFLQ